MNNTENEDSNYLAYTQLMRKDIIKHISSNGIPDDIDERKFLLSALDSMDRTAISKLRLKADIDGKQNSNDVTKIIADLLLNVNAKSATFSDCNRNTPSLNDTFKVTDAVEGETNIGVSNMSYEQFYTT